MTEPHLPPDDRSRPETKVRPDRLKKEPSDYSDVHSKSSRPSSAATNEENATLTEGSILSGKYKLEKQLGEGGVAVVYLARDLEYEKIAHESRMVAIKVLRPEFREQTELVRSLFEEVQKAQSLLGVNIVKIYNCQYDGPNVYMTMEYLEGKTLEQLIDEEYSRGIPWRDARRIIEGVGAGLADAHDHSIIHCDIKPSNIFVTTGGGIKILDFGISRASRNRRVETQGLRGVTLHYASPEAVRAWRAVEEYPDDAVAEPTYRDDIYSFACVCYEMLSGHRPFSDNDAETARQNQLRYPAIDGRSRKQNRTLANGLAFDPTNRTNRVEVFVDGMCKPTLWEHHGFAIMLAGLAAIVSGICIAALESHRLRLPSIEREAITRAPSLPESEATASTRIQARPILSKLGITTEHMSTNGTIDRDSLKDLLQKSPRTVELGSTNAEIDAAVKLCAHYEDKCQRSWYADEAARTVTLKPFALDYKLVTVADFREFVSFTGYKTTAEKSGYAYASVNGVNVKFPFGTWKNAVNQNQLHDNWPVVSVSLSDARAYCAWKGRELPTEDQWEYAARGVDRHTFPWGNDPSDAPAVPPFPFAGDVLPAGGLDGRYFGMAGVVWQWVNSTVGAKQILKGGSWGERNAANLRSAARRTDTPDVADSETGFRCVSRADIWPDADAWLVSVN